MHPYKLLARKSIVTPSYFNCCQCECTLRLSCFPSSNPPSSVYNHPLITSHWLRHEAWAKPRPLAFSNPNTHTPSDVGKSSPPNVSHSFQWHHASLKTTFPPHRSQHIWYYHKSKVWFSLNSVSIWQIFQVHNITTIQRG